MIAQRNWVKFVAITALLAIVHLVPQSISSGQEQNQKILRSAHSGVWSAGSTWEGCKVPPAGSRVQIRTGHKVVYDVKSDQAIRSIHVAGTLTFAPDRDTRLDVGLIKIQPGDNA